MKKKSLNLFSVLWIKPSMMVFSLISAIFVIIANVQLRIYSGRMIDQLGTDSLWEKTLPLFVLFSLILAIFGFINTYTLKRLDGKVSQNIMKTLFIKICGSQQIWLDKQENGNAVTLFTDDINGVQNYVDRIIGGLIPDVFTFVIAFVSISRVNSILSIITVLCSILPIFILSVISRVMAPKHKIFQSAFSEANQTLSKNLTNIELLKSYSLERLASDEYKEKLRNTNKIKKKLSLTESVIYAPAMFMSFFTILVTATYCSWLVGTGSITIGALFSVIMLTDYIIDPVMRISNTLSIIRRAQINIERLNEYLNSPQEETGGLIVDDQHLNIKFQNVSFCYDSRTPILKNCNLNINKGEYICIRGPIGSGKSMILKLITGIFNPDEGMIIVNGRNLNEYNLVHLRSLISVVTQDTVLFTGTIYDNLLMANPQAERSEVERVCQLAAIHDEILNMPDGYNTVIGERAYSLSGGQRQRLSIARAILRNSPILLLDEPSSALDHINASTLKQTISLLTKNKTTIMVTHDTNMIDENARIIEL